MEINASSMLACNVLQNQEMCGFLKKMDEDELKQLREEEFKITEKKFYKIDKCSSTLLRVVIDTTVFAYSTLTLFCVGFKPKSAFLLGGGIALFIDRKTEESQILCGNPLLEAPLKHGRDRLCRITLKKEEVEALINKVQNGGEEIEQEYLNPEYFNIEQVKKVHHAFLEVIEDCKYQEELINRLPEVTPDI